MSEVMMYRLVEIIGDKKRSIKGIIPVCRTSWYEGIKAGRYPKSVRLSERSVAWSSKDIDALIARLSSEVWDVKS
jgi:prophage regulatory protein